MSAVTDEQEYRQGFYEGSEDRFQHRVHHDNHFASYQEHVGYDDGWRFAERVTDEGRQDWAILRHESLIPDDTPRTAEP